MVERKLYLEGESSGKGAFLRQSFSELFKRKVERMPRIKLGGSSNETVKAFLNSRVDEKNWLLIDLDGPEEQRTTRLKNNKLVEREDVCFFMIQEMESWFLSQPNVLGHFYGLDFKSLEHKRAEQISNPCKELKFLTNKSSSKGEYSKLDHDFKLLPLLNMDELENAFSDVKNLIVALNK